MNTRCPMCNEAFHLNKTNEGKVVLCPSCDSSLFVSKILKKQSKVLPFVMDAMNPNENQNELNEELEDLDDFEEDEFDSDAD